MVVSCFWDFYIIPALCGFATGLTRIDDQLMEGLMDVAGIQERDSFRGMNAGFMLGLYTGLW